MNFSPYPTPPMRILTEAAAAERAEEILNGVKPFANDSLYWPSVDELVDTLRQALPGIQRLGKQFDKKFGDDGYMRFGDLLKEVGSRDEDRLLRPDNRDIAEFTAREHASKIRNYLATLSDVPTGDGESSVRLRAVIIAAAEGEYEKLSSLAGTADKLAEEDVENWSFNI